MAAIHVSASCRSIPFDIELMIWRGRTNADVAWLYEASHFHVAAALYSSGGLTRKDASTATPPMERESVTNWCCSLPALQRPLPTLLVRSFLLPRKWFDGVWLPRHMLLFIWVEPITVEWGDYWSHDIQEEKICVKNGGMSRMKHRLVGWLAETMTEPLTVRNEILVWHFVFLPIQ